MQGCPNFKNQKSQISKRIEGADIFTFWDDVEWKNELQNLGANQIFILPTRPTAGPHIVEAMFEKMNTPFLPSILSDAWIGDDWIKNSNMWTEICGCIKKHGAVY